MSDTKSKPSLGFLTVVEHDQFGLFGGYLVLNAVGRPLEFHCTAPIKPNRAQQILYGATLEPYLFGEQIGRTLLHKARAEPLVVLTDREPALSVREYVDVPVTLVLPPEAVGDAKDENRPGRAIPRPEVVKDWRVDAAHPGPCLLTFCLGRNRLAVAVSAADDRALIERRLDGLSESFDLGEPFQRIREAIEEARRGAQ